MKCLPVAALAGMLAATAFSPAMARAISVSLTGLSVLRRVYLRAIGVIPHLLRLGFFGHRRSCEHHQPGDPGSSPFLFSHAPSGWSRRSPPRGMKVSGDAVRLWARSMSAACGFCRRPSRCNIICRKRPVPSLCRRRLSVIFFTTATTGADRGQGWLQYRRGPARMRVSSAVERALGGDFDSSRCFVSTEARINHHTAIIAKTALSPTVIVRRHRIMCFRIESSRFSKKRRKNFHYAGPWALSPTQPMTRHSKIFLLLFVHKK